MTKKKKNSKLKLKIMEMKKTPKGLAILKLIGWVIFFVFLFLFCYISSLISSVAPKENNSPAPELNPPILENNPSLDNENFTMNDLIILEQKLLNNSYHYLYEITINENKYIFNGEQTSINTGYKETNEGIVKYYIDETGIYQETPTSKIPINNLYENLNSNYFDLTYVFGTINTLELTKDLTNAELDSIYKLEDEENIYQIKIANDNIIELKITSKTNNYIYDINFNYGGV